MQQGCQATGKQRGGDQQANIRRRQPGGLTNDQRYGNNAAVHGEHVLQAVSHIGCNAKVLVFWPLR